MKYTAFVLKRLGLSFTLKNEEKVGRLPALILKGFTQDGGGTLIHSEGFCPV